MCSIEDRGHFFVLFGVKDAMGWRHSCTWPRKMEKARIILHDGVRIHWGRLTGKCPQSNCVPCVGYGGLQVSYKVTGDHITVSDFPLTLDLWIINSSCLKSFCVYFYYLGWRPCDTSFIFVISKHTRKPVVVFRITASGRLAQPRRERDPDYFLILSIPGQISGTRVLTLDWTSIRLQGWLHTRHIAQLHRQNQHRLYHRSTRVDNHRYHNHHQHCQVREYS